MDNRFLQRQNRKIRPARCEGFAIWRLVVGPVAQNVPETRKIPATNTVVNAAISVCANVHIRTALKAVIRSGSSTAPAGAGQSVNAFS